MLANGWPRLEIARLTGVSREHVRRVNLALGGVHNPRNPSTTLVTWTGRSATIWPVSTMFTIRPVRSRGGWDALPPRSAGKCRNQDPRTKRYFPRGPIGSRGNVNGGPRIQDRGQPRVAGGVQSCWTCGSRLSRSLAGYD